MKQICKKTDQMDMKILPFSDLGYDSARSDYLAEDRVIVRIISTSMFYTFCVALFLVFSLSLFPVTALANRPVVRVLILETSKEVSLASLGRLSVSDDQGTSFGTFVTSDEGPLVLKPHSSGILLNGAETAMRTIIVDSEKALPTKIGSINYRGQMLISLNNQNRLEIINRLDLEDYLKGIMKAEISPMWSYESLKAQAIVARTYSLFQIDLKRANGAYDLKATVDSQVYKGMAGEDPISNRAVEETAGVALVTDSGYLPALYHACCGGHTEDAESVFYDYPDLIGVQCNYCAASPHFEWELQESPVKLRNLFLREHYRIGPISDISINEKTSSERVDTLLITHSLGRDVIDGKQLRNLIGNDIMRSTLFTIRKDQDTFILNGRGWGHGIGLCQWGAKSMADKGFDCNKILSHYYPRADLKNVY